jgi:eukaryotic-like serine/threonine-protein kinase
MAVSSQHSARARPPSEPRFEPGARIDHYEVIRPLGRGGIGEVHVARDLRLGRLVAIKVLIPSDRDMTKLLLVEARATAKCTHENIVVIHDMNEHQGMPYLVLEYLEGKTLRQLNGEGRLPLVRIVEMMISVVRALDHAHRAGIVHRDLKPDNIFITDAGVVKVLDFGIAKFRDAPSLYLPRAPTESDNRDETYVTIGSKGPVGTRPYMAPEQWDGLDVDHRADIWAVGVTLFLLVSGSLPYGKLSAAELRRMVTSPDSPVPSVTSVVPELHPDLAAIIDRCLRKAKEERFASAADLLAALEQLLPHHTAAGDDRCPYPGLQAFQETDAALFFGRTDQVARVVARLATQPLISIVGPSGAGKSSFVHAGVIPALKREGAWHAITLRPGRSPLLALAALIDPASAYDVDQNRAVAARLVGEPGFLGAVLRAQAAHAGCRILLYVDQFEELYTLVRDPRERAVFVACLRAAADDPSSPVRVLLSLRSDFIDRAAEDDGFMATLTQGMHYLVPLAHEGLLQALLRPAEQAGHSFESAELVARMVSDVSMASGALPLLQFAAARMWEARDRHRRLLTEASYLAMGGIAGALAVHADALLAELSPARRALAQAVLQRVVTADGTRAIVDLDELTLLADPAEVRAVVDELVSARLLVSKSDEHGAGATVELIHESLIAAWPQLQRWVDAGREQAAFLVQIRQAAQQWESRGCPPGLLWRGDAAAEARRFAERIGNTLAPRERRFLDSVVAHATRSSRIKRLAVAATIVVLGTLVIAGLFVVIWVRGAEQEALRQAEEASAARAELAAQLKVVQNKEEARAAAEHQAKEAGADAQLSRSELQRANRQLTDALQAARQASAQQRALREKVEKLLVEERKRSEALAKQRTKMATDLR